MLSLQALEIENTNLELEQLNTELEKRVVDRTYELVLAKEKAEESDRLKSEFLAQMSHEIRTPINVLLSFTGLIYEEMKDTLQDDLLDGFKGINRAGKRITRTIDLILNMSELQTDTYDYQLREFSLYDDVVSNVYIEFYHLAKEKGLELKVENKIGNSILRADIYSVQQIISNLVDNAIKYTEKGEVKILLFRNENNAIVVSVKDSGIGIGDEYIPMLFKPFTQEEQGYTRKFEGNGLGLALVNNYCKLNQAEIKVESSKGVGSEFIVIFKTADSL